MNLLLIYPDIATIQFPHFQHGIASIAAVIKEGGHRVDLLYLDHEMTDDEFVKKVNSYNPDVAAFSSTTQQYIFTKRYAKAIKEKLDLFVVIGGIHATIDPQTVINEGIFDALIRAEGEYPLLELLDALDSGKDYKRIENLWTMDEDDNIIENPQRPPVDISKLPWPDRDVYDNNKLMSVNDYQVSVMASRGCPFRCTYCCNTVLSDLAGGNAKWVRQRPVDDVLEEIDALHKRFPDMKSLIFMDEIFTQKKKYVKEFCEKYKKLFKTPFQIFIRVESVDREMMEWLKDAGMYSIIAGVESGNEEVRRSILNRKMSNEQIIKVFKWADELEIETWDFNMIGVPGDTEDTIRDTMELNKIIRPDHLQISIFYPFPGTPLWEKCIEKGYAKVDESTSVFHSKPVLELPTISRDKLLKLHKEFVALGHQIESEKNAQGYYDLTAKFKNAEIEMGGDEYVELWRVRIDGDDRMAILMHPSSSASYKIEIKPGSKLKFGIGFSEDVWEKDGGGATFKIKIKTRLRKPKTIFEKEINPKKNPDERKWMDHEVDLSAFANKKAELILETKTAPGENQFCAAFWSRPYIESNK